jgi:hypothetical protein
MQPFQGARDLKSMNFTLLIGRVRNASRSL